MKGYIKHIGISLSVLCMVFLVASCEKDKLINGLNNPNNPTAGMPSVITNDVTDITKTSAFGGGNVTSNGASAVTACGVCWSTSHNPTISNNKTTDGTGTGNFTSSITGLASNTTYYVRAYATNAIGTAYGDEKSFRTTTSQNIFIDGFENGLRNWTVSGSNSSYWWQQGSGSGNSSGVSFSHGGSYNAKCNYNGSLNVYSYLKLNLNLSAYTNLKLSFYYCNPNWSSDVDYLYVQYSTDGTNWYNLTSYTGSHNSWTAVSNLNIPTNTRYIRFAAYSRYGYGVGLDDVTITK